MIRRDRPARIYRPMATAAVTPSAGGLRLGPANVLIVAVMAIGGLARIACPDRWLGVACFGAASAALAAWDLRDRRPFDAAGVCFLGLAFSTAHEPLVCLPLSGAALWLLDRKNPAKARRPSRKIGRHRSS